MPDVTRVTFRTPHSWCDEITKTVTSAHSVAPSLLWECARRLGDNSGREDNMLRRAVCLLGVCIFVLGSAPGAHAQEVSSLPIPVAEVSAGYAYMRDTTTEEDFPAGWYVSAVANLNHWFGLAGEMTGAHKKLTDFTPVTVKADFYTFMGGPRFFFKRGRFVPFAQVLAGAAHLRWKATGQIGALDPSDTDSKFAFQPGGGVTVLLTPNVSVRGAADYRRIVFTDADEFDEDNSQVRAMAGIVFGWGAR